MGGHGFLTSREVSYWKGLQYTQALSQLLCAQLESGLPLQDSCSPEVRSRYSFQTFLKSLLLLFSEYSDMGPELNLIPECT